MPTPPSLGPGDVPARTPAALPPGGPAPRSGATQRRRAWLGTGAAVALCAIAAGVAELSSGGGGEAAGAAPLPTGTGPDSAAFPGALGALPTVPLPTPTPPLTPPAAASTQATAGGATVTGPATVSVTSAAPSSAPSSAPTTAAPQPPATSAAPASFLGVQAALSGGSSPYWSQDTVTVTLTAPVSSLKVAVRIAQTGGVADSGTWSSLPGGAVVAFAASGTALNYEFTAAPGMTLPAGQYVFAVEYRYGTPYRSVAHDLYDVVAVAAGSGEHQGLGGRF